MTNLSNQINSIGRLLGIQFLDFGCNLNISLNKMVPLSKIHYGILNYLNHGYNLSHQPNIIIVEYNPILGNNYPITMAMNHLSAHLRPPIQACILMHLSRLLNR